ncbi:hypothetical protein DTO212C5_4536 [Paecilomyces variotii]|nr:hypothetical protein DTO212C5_4536 [Paecilomyces variotii]
MRTVEESRKRWDAIFQSSKGPSDLKRALKFEDDSDNCDDTLRSVYWKAFLLYNDLDFSEWPSKIADSRSAYSALRDHFLKYIEHPDDLPSTADPLAEDEESPWQSLRRDEAIRAEIYQDVERCLQDNHFFREPSTKARMLDVLFIYTKLNPDLGYRQGMHELLAPVLWVVERDSIEKKSLQSMGDDQSYDDLMLQVLDETFIEHDAFTLFCTIMQVARVYYEPGEQRSGVGQMDVAPIVNRCQYIHQGLLTVADEGLAEHLYAIEILPQIFLTRWIRLLFGREFPFDDVLVLWDFIFAEGLRTELIDLICVAMLLRIRWQLLEADYPMALSLLLRYPSPHPHPPWTFVQDALYLEQNLTADRGSFLISKYSGRPPERSFQHQTRPMLARTTSLRTESRGISGSSSPGRSPARSSQKNLETIFQDVSQGIQRRTEAWGVAKAVRGAMNEARRNIQTIQSNASSPTSRPWQSPSSSQSPPRVRGPHVAELNKKIQLLEDRNKRLSRMLGEALNVLQSQKSQTGEAEQPTDTTSREAFDQALAKARSVQSYLEDSSKAITPSDRSHETSVQKNGEDRVKQGVVRPDVHGTNATQITPTLPQSGGIAANTASNPKPIQPVPLRPAQRHALADSEFSWMLGDKRHHSSFVSSASVPPEQSRHGDKIRQNSLFTDGKGEENRKKFAVGDDDDDGLVLSSFGGANS